MGNIFSHKERAALSEPEIVGLQTHEDESPLAFTIMFDDLDRGRRMVATVSDAAFFDSAAYPRL